MLYPLSKLIPNNLLLIIELNNIEDNVKQIEEFMKTENNKMILVSVGCSFNTNLLCTRITYCNLQFVKTLRDVRKIIKDTFAEGNEKWVDNLLLQCNIFLTYLNQLNNECFQNVKSNHKIYLYSFIFQDDQYILRFIDIFNGKINLLSAEVLYHKDRIDLQQRIKQSKKQYDMMFALKSNSSMSFTVDELQKKCIPDSACKSFDEKIENLYTFYQEPCEIDYVCSEGLLMERQKMLQEYSDKFPQKYTKELSNVFKDSCDLEPGYDLFDSSLVPPPFERKNNAFQDIPSNPNQIK